jgi:transposase
VNAVHYRSQDKNTQPKQFWLFYKTEKPYIERRQRKIKSPIQESTFSYQPQFLIGLTCILKKHPTQSITNVKLTISDCAHLINYDDVTQPKKIQN